MDVASRGLLHGAFIQHASDLAWPARSRFLRLEVLPLTTRLLVLLGAAFEVVARSRLEGGLGLME